MRSAAEFVEIPSRLPNVASIVIAESTPDKPAVVMDDGRILTYAQLEADSNRLAHLFRDLGLKRGDHIALVLENRPEFFVVAWAATRAGLYFTPASGLNS